MIYTTQHSDEKLKRLAGNVTRMGEKSCMNGFGGET